MRDIQIELEDDRPLIFLVGAALSYDRTNRTGVPDVEESLRLIQTLTHEKYGAALKLRGETPAEQYRNAFTDLRKMPGGADDWIVRNAVLRACTLPKEDETLKKAAMFGREAERASTDLQTNRTSEWDLPPGVEILAAIVKKAQDAVRRRGSTVPEPLIITTNFDGLIEVALTREGVKHNSVSAAHDPQVEPIAGCVNIWHVHGYWCKGPTHHTADVIRYPRQNLEMALRNALNGALVYVMGYGGWRDAVFKTISDLANTNNKLANTKKREDNWRPPKVLWALYQKERENAQRENRHVFKAFRNIHGKTYVHFFLGVDVHCMHCDKEKENLWCLKHPSPRVSRMRVTLGSNTDQDSDVIATNEILDAFAKEQGFLVRQNPHEHEGFKGVFEDDYLPRRPDDVVAWLAGQCVGKAAVKHVVRPLPDEILNAVRKRLSPWVRMPPDEESYVLPFKTYPWAFYYRRRAWEERKYSLPTNWRALVALARRMRSDNIPFPIAFGNCHRWPALMTFDILNMRLNGPDFHRRLLEGHVSWTDGTDGRAIRQVFQHWQELTHFYPTNCTKLSYQDGTSLLMNDMAGMYFVGGFIVSEVDDEVRKDLGVFVFPEMNPSWGTDAIDAPIDGYVLPTNACPSRTDAAEALIQYLGTADAFDVYNRSNPGFIGVIEPEHTKRNSRYAYAVQSDSAQLLKATRNTFRGMERETKKPGFVQKVVMPAFEAFLCNSTSAENLDTVLRQLEEGRHVYFFS